MLTARSLVPEKLQIERLCRHRDLPSDYVAASISIFIGVFLPAFLPTSTMTDSTFQSCLLKRNSYFPGLESKENRPSFSVIHAASRFCPLRVWSPLLSQAIS